jgi:3-oxoadipate enol-lactonase
MIAPPIMADSNAGTYQSILPGNLAYQEWGSSNGAPLVFIHGFPFDHRMWRSQIEFFKQNYRVITYDIRGFGASEPGDGQYSLEIFVDDFLALLDHLKVEKATVVGFSMGGYIALRAIERNPNRFARLVLADTQSGSDSDAAKVKRTDTLKTIKLKGISTFAGQFLKSALFSKTTDTNPALVSSLSEWIQSQSTIGVSGGVLGLMSRTDTTEALSKIKIPTQIMVGENDGITPVQIAKAMQETISGSILKVISLSGHMTPLENPNEFNSSLNEFLQKSAL